MGAEESSVKPFVVVNHSVGLVADWRTHRLQAGGGSVLVRCLAASWPVRPLLRVYIQVRGDGGCDLNGVTLNGSMMVTTDGVGIQNGLVLNGTMTLNGSDLDSTGTQTISGDGTIEIDGTGAILNTGSLTIGPSISILDQAKAFSQIGDGLGKEEPIVVLEGPVDVVGSGAAILLDNVTIGSTGSLSLGSGVTGALNGSDLVNDGNVTTDTGSTIQGGVDNYGNLTLGGEVSSPGYTSPTRVS